MCKDRNVIKNPLISFIFIICLCFCGQLFSQVPVGDPIPAAKRWDQYEHLIEGKSVGLCVNHSSLVDGTHLVDLLFSQGVQIKRIFAPEHGFRGTADAGSTIDDTTDETSGAEVISLYGSKKKPAEKDLAGLDLMIFDIQDVGVRFYTYISTMHYVMEACAENAVPVIVLDRPNPNGYYVDGPILEPEQRSFVGLHPIPVVYGMTIGELALMINGERWLANGVQCDLTVIECADYHHHMTCKLPVQTSPNLPNLRSILLYPSLCYFEGTSVSVGRGTNKQFQVIGHPDFPNGDFVFSPKSMPGATNPKHINKIVFGRDLSQLTIAEITSWQKINLTWLHLFHRLMHEDNGFFLEGNFFDKLAGNESLRTQLAAGKTEEEISESWQEDLEVFLLARKKYLLYEDFDW